MVREKFIDFLNKATFKQNKSLMDRLLLALYNTYSQGKQKLFSNHSEVISRLYLQTRHLKRKNLGGRLSFLSIEDLVVWTNQWIPSLPQRYDVIVGIPRSGLLVATIVALRLGKPLTTPDLFSRNDFWLSNRLPYPDSGNNILLVDDSVDSGQTMAEAHMKVESAAPDGKITTAALIVSPESAGRVDCYHKIIPLPRVFEWNLLHCKKGKLVSDLDGVLAENCPSGYDQDEKLYVKWLKNCKPYIIPYFEIDVILSSRLEKYRRQTEVWLKQHHILYKKLILWDLDCKSNRQGKNAQFKIKHILRIQPDLVWESSYLEAKEIWEKTKVPTLCTDEMILFS